MEEENSRGERSIKIRIFGDVAEWTRFSFGENYSIGIKIKTAVFNDGFRLRVRSDHTKNLMKIKQSSNEYLKLVTFIVYIIFSVFRFCFVENIGLCYTFL